MTTFSPSFVLHLKLQMSCLHSRSWTVCYLFTYADDAAAHHHLMLLTSYECKAASKMRGKKSIKAPAIYITLHQFEVTLPLLYFTSSSPFNLPLVSLPEFNSDRPRLTRRGLWSACGSLFTCVYESLRGIFSSKDETRPRRGRVRSETSVSNLVSKAQKSWSSRKHTMVPQNISASPLGVLPSRKLPAASCRRLLVSQLVWTYCNVCECEWARNLLCNTAATMHLKCLGAGSN